MPPDALTRLLHDLLHPASSALPEANWQPAADVYQTREGWLVKFDLAGVRPEEIELTISGQTLTVGGRRRDWLLEETQSCYSMEISYSQFQRAVRFPCDIERAEILTDYREGMLLVRLSCREAGR